MQTKFSLNQLSRFEPFLFVGVVCFFAYTFFKFDYFITADGPSHVYNANLLGDLLFGSDPLIESYFELNRVLVPNWIGHFLIGIFDYFLPSNDAEKLFLAVYFFSFLYSLRYLIKSFRPSHGFYALFFLPFVLNLFLYSGFYNFAFAFILLFLVIGYYNRNYDQLTVKRMGVLTFLFLLLYFSHLLVLVAGICVTGSLLTWYVIIEQTNFKIKFVRFFQLVSRLFLTTIPVLILIGFYTARHGESRVILYKSNAELWNMIVEVRPLMGHGPAENEYSQFYFLLLLLLVLLSVFQKKWRFELKKEDGFVVIAGFILFFYFVLPDGDGEGGFLSVRILYLFFTMLVFRITLFKLPHAVMFIFVVLIVINTNAQLKIRKEGQALLSDFANEIAFCGHQVDAHSTVLPISTSPHWMTQNLFNYLAPDKSVVFLMNYEALHPYFPVCWKKKPPIQQPYTIQPAPICQTHLHKFPYFKLLPDYLFFYGGNIKGVECWPNDFGDLNYQIVYESDYCSLYRSNNH